MIFVSDSDYGQTPAGKACFALLSACLISFGQLKANALENAEVVMHEKARNAFVDQLNSPEEKKNVGLSYWIELDRAGKTFRCNNKCKFKSGDQIRFHIVADADGYAYILLKHGFSGHHRLLFPDQETGINNQIKRGHDYVIPTEAALQFDNTPGVEVVGLLFSRTKLNAEQYMNFPAEQTCYISARQDGSKDLVPTRMQLAWDEPDPVIMPGNMIQAAAPQVVSFTGESALTVDITSSRQGLKAHLKDKSYVYVVSESPDRVLSLDVALQHE